MINEKTVLVIDDDPAIRRLYVNLIYSYRLMVLEAASAEEATEILMRLKVDLILLDINMPDIDGSMTHEIIRTFGTKVKVIIASVLPVEKQRRLIPGADDYYDKAQGIDSLLAKIWNILDDRSFFRLSEGPAAEPA